MQANTAHEPDPRYSHDANNNDQYSNDDYQATGSTKKFRLRLSQRLHYTAELAFVSYILLIIAFASPYWLSSYDFTSSAFKRLGLWDFCFQDYRHPSYQYDMKLNGCHWIYSSVYTSVRDWLRPPWFIFVQAIVTMALCVSTIGLSAISIIFMHFLIQYQLVILLIAMVCHTFTTMLLGFAVATFYLKAFEKSWIMYPEFNHVDWGFFLALFSLVGNGMSSYLYYLEVKLLKDKMLKLKRLIVASPNVRSTTGGEIDSIDDVYASRSLNVYQSMGNDSQKGRGPQGPTSKHSPLVYPFYTQV